MKKIILIIIIITLLFVVNFVFADSKIIINEFLIDPQPQSVEIFNSGTESADISGWIIDDDGSSSGTYSIPVNSIIYPNACLVFSSNFYLNKSSADTIRLINNSQQLIDSFSYKSSSGSGISYLRQPDGTNNWATGSANLGFYNVSKEQKCLFPTMTPTPTLEPTLTIMPTLTDSTDSTDSTDLTNIYLSEAMVNPMTGEKEWVEIYNNNDFTVSLNNWFIDDLENAGSSPKIFSLEINAKGYGIFNLTSSMFNNDGDSVRLLDLNKNLKDDFEYQKTETGKTLGRTSIESDDFCIQEPSKNSTNNPCIDQTPATIKSITIAQTIISPAIKIASTKIIPNTKLIASIKPVSINQLIDTKTIKTRNLGQVLGTSDELIINTPNNKPLINLLSILSTSYSLLVIISILIKNIILKKYALAS